MKFKGHAILLSISILIMLFSACKKKTVEKIVTETKTDTVTVVDHDTVIINNYVKDSATTFILSRHTETTGIGADPMLSPEGEQRAASLAATLNTTKIYAVYSSDYNRTRQTATAVAANNSLTVQIYDPMDADALIAQVLTSYKSKIVYIAGHSNTVPALLNKLTGSNTYADIPETEYDNLYIVNVFEKGRAQVVHLKY